MSNHRVRSFMMSGVLALCGSCGGNFEEPWFISSPRVVGAKTQAVADRARSSLAPGEEAEVSFLVANPEQKNLSGVFLLCPEVSISRTFSVCKGLPQLFPAQAPSNLLSRLQFTVPSAEALVGTENLLLVGVICEDEMPTVDASQLQGMSAANADPTKVLYCSSREKTVDNVYMLIDLVVEEGAEKDINASPSFASVEVKLADQVWGSNSRDCTQTISARVDPGDAYQVHIAWNPGWAEAEETMLFSHFTNKGKLDKKFTVVEPGVTPENNEIKVVLTMPTEIPSEGERIHFWTVLRDKRGGVDWFERTLCIVSQ